MKSKLKQQIIEKLNSLSKEDVLEKSSRIKSRLFGILQYKKSKTAMFFASFKNEVHTHEMIKAALKNKTVIIPKVLHDEIEPSVIMDFGSLKAFGKFKILEPVEITKIAYKKIGLVLVPGIVFDEYGHRIGYGFGYYDKFLRKVPKAAKIGLAFNFQVVGNIPREEHDVPVDMIVTDKRIIKCKKSE